ncbi:MAG TPA: MFS transporter [Steroidobacteraceae bacterium]|nr:MFS transporter [Steroidobacteraceae bacterium]
MTSSSATAHAATQPRADGLPVPRRYWAIATIILALTMSVLDSTIVNVALPSLAHDFHTTDAASVWVVNAYQIAILVALLPLASLGEIVGYRRISQCGLAVFTLASLGCALAPNLTTLSIARVVQGLGAAGIMSVNSALVRFTYPHRMLGRAIGINAFSVAVASAIGPTIASAILAVAQWRWLFAVNVPIGIVTFAIALFALPDSERTPRRLNHVGVALQAGTFGLLMVGLQSFAHETMPALRFAELGGGCLLAVLLVRHEIDRATPLIPFDLLRIRVFTLSVGTSIGSFMAATAALIAVPFEIQHLGHSAAETGLLMTPWPAAVAIAAPLAGYLADRHPAGILASIGLLAMCAGVLLLAFFPHDGSSFGLLWRMALCGLGFGFFQTPNNRTLLNAAPYARMGAAGGMLATARLLGQTLGAAAVAVLFRAYPVRGSHAVLVVAAAISLLAASISASRLAKEPAPESDLQP